LREVKKAVFSPVPPCLFDWMVVVQLPEGSFQAAVQPSGPPVVPSVLSLPSGFSDDFFQTFSSGSVRSSGEASHQLSPGSPGYVAIGVPLTIVTEPVKIPARS